MRKLLAAAAVTLLTALAPCVARCDSSTDRAAASEMARVDALAVAVERRLDDAADAHFHEGEYNHTINLYRIMVSIAPHDVEAYSNAGYLLWSLGKDAEAVAFYQDGIRANPDSSYTLDDLGQYYARKKNWPEAIRVLTKAAGMADAYGGTYHTLAIAYERTGQPKLALETWRMAIKKNRNPSLLGVEKVHLQRMQQLVERQAPVRQ